jgi:hypothetical protein
MLDPVVAAPALRRPRSHPTLGPPATGLTPPQVPRQGNDDTCKWAKGAVVEVVAGALPAADHALVIPRGAAPVDPGRDVRPEDGPNGPGRRGGSIHDATILPSAHGR